MPAFIPDVCDCRSMATLVYAHEGRLIDVLWATRKPDSCNVMDPSKAFNGFPVFTAGQLEVGDSRSSPTGRSVQPSRDAVDFIQTRASQLVAVWLCGFLPLTSFAGGTNHGSAPLAVT